MQEQEGLMGGGPKQPVQTQRAAVHAQPYPGGARAAGGRSGSPVVVHNPKVQSVRYGPGGDGPVYEQHDARKVDSDSARVAHLQYNSPIGLYSKQNALDVLHGQTAGKPGEGTMQITGGVEKPAWAPPGVQSDLYRMIMEEEHGGRGRPSSGGNVAQPRRAPHRSSRPETYSEPPQEPRSYRLNQLVNENNDQLDEYLRMPHHSTAFAGSHGGISDF